MIIKFSDNAQFTVSALACGLQAAYSACSCVHCCLQDHAVMLTDVLADLLARPAVLVSRDQHVTGYSHSQLQSRLVKLPHDLLYELMHIPVAQHCWLYFGQTLFPTCTQVYVGMARDLMCKSDRGDPPPSECHRMEPFVHMLGDCLPAWVSSNFGQESLNL
jgi:hypothetical protein